MTAPGTTIESPRIRQTITFVRTSDETDGAELVIEALMRPGAFVPRHIHLHQQEDFEVLEGTGTFRVGKEEISAPAGQRLTVPPHTAHRFKNDTAQDVRVRATLRPALRTEELFERLFRLGAEGRVNRLGAPNPFATASLIREFPDEF